MLICGMAIQNEEERCIVEELYNDYHRLMLYIAKGILSDQEKAEDAVSQTFLKIIDNLQKFSFEDRNKTKGLIGILIRNICFDMIRKENRRTAIPLEDIELIGDINDLPYEAFASEESYQAILNDISDLNDKSASVLKLKYVFDYSDHEIADLLNISHDNVRVRLHRAKSALMKKLRERGDSNE